MEAINMKAIPPKMVPKVGQIKPAFGSTMIGVGVGPGQEQSVSLVQVVLRQFP